MSYAKHLQTYQTTAIQSASPLQLIIMLYDGALRFIRQGKIEMEKQNLFEQNQNLVRAQKILTELMSCLDMQQGGEIAQNLLALYTYCYNELLESNLNDNPENLDRAVKVLEGLRESWVEIEKQTRNAPSEQNEQPRAA